MTFMNREEIRQGLNGIFRALFDQPSLEVRETMTAADVEGWDSLNHVNLMVAVEKKFKVTFSIREITALKNVGDLMTTIEKHLVP